MKLCLLLSSFWMHIMCLNTVVSQRIPLNFGYITTLTGSFIGDGGIPVVDMALRLINERNDVLQNYTLNYTDVLDSACDRTMSLNQFFKLINRNTTYISLLGCGCSPATIPVAELSHYWNIPQLSVVSAANSLDNRIKFRNFYRTSVPFHDVGESLGQLMREFGWRQMSIITQDESLFSLVTENISNIFNNEGWTLDRYDVTSGQSPLPFFDRSETGSFRIFHINAYQDMAYQLLCEAYHRGMTGSDYLWIIPMWYNDNWWMSSSPTSSTNPSCTDAIMMEVITGTIGWIPRKYLTLNESITTFSGLTPNAYLGNYTALLQESRYRNITKFGFSGVVFDGVWAIAIGLDIASKKISSGNDSGCENVPGDLVPLEQFNYANTKLGCIFKKSFNEIDFVGVTGQVKFNEFGSRNDEFIQYQQYRLSNSRLTKVHFGSVYVEGQRSSFVFSSGESNSTLWKDGIPPYDGIPERGLDQNSIALIVIYDILAGFGIIFAAVCFIFNVVFRNKKIVKLTSPNLNHIIILGSVLLYICVFFYTFLSTDKTTEAVFCNVRVWLFSLGYCLCFGVILSKTWRVYHIFNNPKPTKKGVKDWFLFLIVSFIIAIDVFIILIGTIVPQSRLTSFEVVDGENPQITNDDGKLQNNFVVVCNTRTETLIWEGLSFGYKGILQVLAIFMAFHTRGVKVRILNESKETAAIIYINSIVLLLLTVTEFTLATRHNTYSALFGLGLLIEASLFLGLIFIPKMIHLYLDPQGAKIFTQANTSNTHVNTMMTTNSIDNKDSPEEITANLRQRVKELEQEISIKMKDLKKS